MKSLRVVHLTSNLPGPLAMSRLVKQGFSVLKIEPPDGDPLERYYPEWYRELHLGQRIQRLDLKDPSARARLEEYLSEAHLFVSTVRPLALKKSGLDEETLRRKFPSLHLLFIQGYPAPKENEPAHDLTCQAEVGLLVPGELPRALIADFAASERAFAMSLLALLKASGGEPGTCAKISLSEMAKEFATAWKIGMTTPRGPLGGSLPHYNVYQTSDGWIALAALEPHFLKKTLTLLGLNSPDHAEFTRIFAKRTKAEWEKLAREHDIPLSALK